MKSGISLEKEQNDVLEVHDLNIQNAKNSQLCKSKHKIVNFCRPTSKISGTYSRIIPKKPMHDVEDLYSENINLKSKIKNLQEMYLKVKTRVTIAEKQKDQMKAQIIEKQNTSIFLNCRKVHKKHESTHQAPKINIKNQYLRRIFHEYQDMIDKLSQQNSTLKRSVKYTQISQLQIENRELNQQILRIKQVMLEHKQEYQQIQQAIHQKRQKLREIHHKIKKKQYHLENLNSRIKTSEEYNVKFQEKSTINVKQKYLHKTNSDENTIQLKNYKFTEPIIFKDHQCIKCKSIKNQNISLIRQTKKNKQQKEKMLEEIKILNDKIYQLDKSLKYYFRKTQNRETNSGETENRISFEETNNVVNDSQKKEKQKSQTSKTNKENTDEKNNNIMLQFSQNKEVNIETIKQSKIEEEQPITKNYNIFLNIPNQPTFINKSSHYIQQEQKFQEKDPQKQQKQNKLNKKQKKKERKKKFNHILRQTFKYRMIGQRYIQQDFRRDMNENSVEEFQMEEFIAILTDQPFFLNEQNLKTIIVECCGNNFSLNDFIPKQKFVQVMSELFQQVTLLPEIQEQLINESICQKIENKKQHLLHKFNQQQQQKNIISNIHFIEILSQIGCFSTKQIEQSLAQASFTSKDITLINYVTYMKNVSNFIQS